MATIQSRILNKLLSTKRPHKSKTNERITEWLRTQLPFDLQQTAFFDGAGNLHVDNRSLDKHRTLFVAHIDTVHHSEGKNKIRKTKTHWHAKGDVLGADDGAGVALLFHMIWSGVAGYYVFTQGEERGGVGAKYLADKMLPLLKQFDRAVAFDRRGIDSVITHQGWGRCCSDTFGNALADALMEECQHLMMLNDDTGVYTDTAEFVDVIPECTNISVGYDREHTQAESLNLVYYQHLSSAVVGIDWDGLPTERDPSVREDKYETGSWWQEYKTYTSKSYGANDWFLDGDDDAWEFNYKRQDAIDAVFDAQYGFTDDLALLISASVYPEEPKLAVKHMNFKQLDPRILEEAHKALEGGEDVDLVLCSLFDDLYVM